jgi:CRP/FNR family cyclic AMP-dependent transcriptional regulator
MPLVAEMSDFKTARDVQNAFAALASREPKSLPAAGNPELEPLKRPLYYPVRSVLFREGEPPVGIFIVKRGTVKLFMTSSKGRAVILRIARAGEILGLSSVLSGDPYLATAETLEDTEVSYVEREPFLETLTRNPQAALSVAHQACAIYKDACRQVSLLGLCRSASERLAQFLLNWTAPRIYRDAPSVWLGLTHEEISQIAGTTRETVTRTLIDFRKRGWAALASSHLVIQDREALEKLVV